LFAQAQPGANGFSTTTVHQYANNLKAWLLFAGLLDQRGRWIFRPSSTGALAGVLRTKRHAVGLFLGSSAPSTLTKLLRHILREGSIARADAGRSGFRNALADAAALGLVTFSAGVASLAEHADDEEIVIRRAKGAVIQQPTVNALAAAWGAGIRQSEALGRNVEEAIGASWQPRSAMRYATGLRRYWDWATGTNRKRTLHRS
jgi:hypothetical protein